jgi:hypothetical protein
MFNANTLAKAKLVHNKKLNLYKLVVAFNVTRRHPITDKLIFPVQKQCAFVSGDITTADVFNALKQAETALRTNNIVIVD